ncbi:MULTISPECIES: DUF4212 domain-containing protein [Natronorubrum]|uniref:Putative solute:sodium symporter small subunit n=2 Tax=Natronorubrum TaxID=134813 RepID=A0A1N6Y6T3_9EURY|nr:MULTISPECIES: DUF4212 domain-containing protein [Natronorubrum]APX95759.1 sodium:solute symporter [Natronorubrum daqingense]SEH11420.1 putative solute:sodium symporter small subunit [Natronorubrum sediminis]SIR10290.1 putative solute:sodium symporter small subunit [Natronorubrum daqingense]
MSDNTSQDTEHAAETDGGVKTEAYLDKEINIFKPATPFMRDHLRVIWLSFVAWIVVVFGPTTAILFAPEFMTETTVLGGFPLHFFLAAIVTPLGALLLSVGYAMQRDRLDTKYGISHEEAAESDGTVAADGGEP